jgi:adenosine deaminase
VTAGSVRIGHGLNVMQRIEFLPYCRFVCFEKCPMSNLLIGYTGDPRESSAPILLGLGYAVSINVGNAGKLGVEDSTADFFVTLVSYDWTLKHLKLIALHSINHSLQRDKDQNALLLNFEERWNEWIDNFLVGAH